ENFALNTIMEIVWLCLSFIWMEHIKSRSRVHKAVGLLWFSGYPTGTHLLPFSKKGLTNCPVQNLLSWRVQYYSMNFHIYWALSILELKCKATISILKMVIIV